MTYAETERLTLSQPCDADVDAIFAIHSDPGTYDHAPHLTMQTQQQAQDLLSNWQGCWERHGIGYGVVRAKTSGEIVGFCGVKPMLLNGDQVLNLYYRFAPESQGLGYATQAARAVVDHGATRYPDRPVIAKIATVNASSIRLAEKLGCEHTDIQDDDDESPDIPHVIYASRMW